MVRTAIAHGSDAFAAMGRDTPESSRKERLRGLRAMAEPRSLEHFQPRRMMCH